MTVFLKETDQRPNQCYSIWESAEGKNSTAIFDSLISESSLSGRSTDLEKSIVRRTEFDQLQITPAPFVSFEPISPRTASLKSHLSQGRAANANFLRSRLRSERDDKHQQALLWLSENRQCYAGQWIALQGSQLLATGKTAKEVYSQLPKQLPPALVIKIEAEELPFGGW